MDSQYKEWIDIASQDLASAKYLLSMKPVPLEIICYHCQQSAEKYLKAFMAFKSMDIIKTHDLTALYKVIVDMDTSFEILKNECIDLTDFSVSTRYPYKLELDIKDAKKAIKDAENIQTFISSKLNGKKK
jgi:HEPN domain-containing protein